MISSGIRRVSCVLLLTIAMAVLLSGCIKKVEDVTVNNEVEAVQPFKVGDGVVRLVTEVYVPYSFEERGQVVGVGTDVVKEVFRRLGMKTEIQVLPWTRALQMTYDGEADGIFCAFYSEDRARYLDYPHEALAYESQLVFTKEGATIAFDGTLDSLAPYTIGVMQDYFYGDEFDRRRLAGTLDVQSVTDMQTNIRKLLDGRIDVLIDHRLSNQYYLKQMGLSGGVEEQTVLFREPAGLYLAFSKKRQVDPDFINRINEEIKKMKDDGTYQEIVDRYTK